MENKELYPELADYIFEYCQKYFLEKELIANRHLFALAKSHGDTNNRFYSFFMKEARGPVDEEVEQLIEGGFVRFKDRVTRRIYEEHKEKLVLNLCPKCGKIARTKWAQQCRFCFHDWH